MANMTNIVDFNQSDGLPPWVVQKLNNNMWQLAQKITDPQVVMVSGVNPPEPHTNETMFYDTQTGDVYIWAQVNAADPGYTPSLEWTWLKVDLGLIRIVDNPPPIVSDQQTDYQVCNEIIWYALDESMVYFLVDPNSNGTPLWYSAYDLFKIFVTKASNYSGLPGGDVWKDAVLKVIHESSAIDLAISGHGLTDLIKLQTVGDGNNPPVIAGYGKATWLACPGFVEAVNDIIGN